jgi:type IV pilus assembly protein PilA
MNYVVIHGDKTQGPYSRDQILAMLSSTALSVSDSISAVDGQPWTSIGEHPDFASVEPTSAAIGEQTASKPLSVSATPQTSATGALTLSAMYHAFIGPEKADYYVPRFERFDSGGSSVSWNWPAALITQFWMLGRGMFLWGFLLYPILGSIVSVILASAASAILGPKGYLPANALYLLLSMLVMGAYGNRLFHRHARKLIDGSGQLGLSDSDRRDWIIRRGATSYAWIVIVVFVGIALVGILAAIAIPAYQDYVLRAKVAEGLNRVRTVQKAYGSFVADHHEAPTSMSDLELSDVEGNGPDVSSIRIGDSHQIAVTFKGAVAIEGTTVELVPVVSGGSLTWTCRSIDVPKKYLPKACRN